MIFEEEAPCMSHKAMSVVSEVVDWFTSRDGTHLKVFGFQKQSHLLLRYAINKIVIQQVAYHLVIGLSVMLQRKKKA